MKRNTFILKCFLQFTCTNLDGFQKEGEKGRGGGGRGGGGFFKFALESGGFQEREVPSEKGGSNPGGNHEMFL